jgi:hypothetical protein
MPAVSPEDVKALQKYARQDERRALYLQERDKLIANAPARSWYEDPVALGTLLIIFPPIGLAALWSSKRYSNDARWALTVMTALMMCLGAAIAVALAVRA